MKYGLLADELASIQSILANNNNVESAILYGSRAKGNFKQGSDIDITLVGKKLNYSDLVNISLALDNLLLPYEFDLSLYKDIENRDLLTHIKRVGKCLYERQNLT